jgi:hypothetical protein
MQMEASAKRQAKLKREGVEDCLNCKKFVDCDDIGKFEHCVGFEETEDEA